MSTLEESTSPLAEDELKPVVLATLSVRLPPACIEFVPEWSDGDDISGDDEKKSRFCVVGVYSLIEGDGDGDNQGQGQTRAGGLEVYRVDVSGDDVSV